MTAYRFCRSDDLGLLAEAANRCWRPHFAEEAGLTVADLKREIRELDLWTSSCMVAFEGDEPVAVLHACKRDETLVHRIATHPDHLRRGHASHLLTSLSAKLAILGPPRLVAEVPAENARARALFEACGWSPGEELVDWEHPGGLVARASPLDEMVVPVLVDEIDLEQVADRAWYRGPKTLRNVADQLSGLAIASPAGYEAWILWRTRGGLEVLGMHGPAALLDLLFRRMAARRTADPIHIPRVGGSEPAEELVRSWGGHPRSRHVRFTAVGTPA